MMEETSIAPAERYLALLEHRQTALQPIYPQLFERAKAALQSMSWPTSRMEDWRYSRSARLSGGHWNFGNPNAGCDVLNYAIPGLECDTLVFADGFFRPDLSTANPDPAFEVSFEWKAEDQEREISDLFQAMSYALATAAIRIRVKKNQRASRSLHILHITCSKDVYAAPFIEVNAEASSDAHIVESFVAQEKTSSFTNRSLHIHLAENARLHLDKLQMEGDDNFEINEDYCTIAGNGNFTINTLTIDGGWIRNQLNIELLGENIEANLHGAYLPRKKQFVDNHTRVDHQKPHCNSNEIYKGVLHDQSSGVFNGKIYVRPDAQKTNAFQNNANILVSEDAQMNTKPELEIYADDVKCSHGTTTGQMDEEAVFYLKARGIGEENAKRLLTSAFIGDVVNKIRHEAVKSYVVGELMHRGLLFE